jgi:hypothetical protein
MQTSKKKKNSTAVQMRVYRSATTILASQVYTTSTHPLKELYYLQTILLPTPPHPLHLVGKVISWDPAQTIVVKLQLARELRA